MIPDLARSRDGVGYANLLEKKPLTGMRDYTKHPHFRARCPKFKSLVPEMAEREEREKAWLRQLQSRLFLQQTVNRTI